MSSSQLSKNCFVFLFFLTFFALVSSASFSDRLNYRGKYTVSDVWVSGDYNFEFRIVDSNSGVGNILFDEWHRPLTVFKGNWTVRLGDYNSLNSLLFDKNYFLETWVGNVFQSRIPLDMVATANRSKYFDANALTGSILYSQFPLDFNSQYYSQLDADENFNQAFANRMPIADGNLAWVYAVLAGRAGGQILKGGTSAGENLSFWTNATGTIGHYYFTDLSNNGFVKTRNGTGELWTDLNAYLSSGDANSLFVPYNDANRDVNLGANDLLVAFINDLGDKRVLNTTFRFLYDSSSLLSVAFGSRGLYDSAGVSSIDWNTRILSDALGNSAMQWGNRFLLNAGSVLVADWTNEFRLDKNMNANNQSIWGINDANGKRFFQNGNQVCDLSGNCPNSMTDTTLDTNADALTSFLTRALTWGGIQDFNQDVIMEQTLDVYGTLKGTYGQFFNQISVGDLVYATLDYPMIMLSDQTSASELSSTDGNLLFQDDTTVGLNIGTPFEDWIPLKYLAKNYYSNDFLQSNNFLVPLADGNLDLSNVWSAIDGNKGLSNLDLNGYWNKTKGDENVNALIKAQIDSNGFVKDLNAYWNAMKGDENFNTKFKAQYDANQTKREQDINKFIQQAIDLNNWGIDTNAETACDANEVLTGDGLCVPYVVSQTYLPTYITTVAGTDVNNNDLNAIKYYDNNSYTVREKAGASPVLTVDVNFAGVSSFDSIILRERYDGGLGHEVLLYLWDYVLGDWESYAEFTDQEGFVVHYLPVADSNDHISGSNPIRLRIYHVGTGVATHYFYLDFAWLQKGTTTLSNASHDSLSGRNSITNHPWALAKADVNVAIQQAIDLNNWGSGTVDLNAYWNKIKGDENVNSLIKTQMDGNADFNSFSGVHNDLNGLQGGVGENYYHLGYVHWFGTVSKNSNEAIISPWHFNLTYGDADKCGDGKCGDSEACTRDSADCYDLGTSYACADGCQLVKEGGSYNPASYCVAEESASPAKDGLPYCPVGWSCTNGCEPTMSAGEFILTTINPDINTGLRTTGSIDGNFVGDWMGNSILDAYISSAGTWNAKASLGDINIAIQSTLDKNNFVKWLDANEVFKIASDMNTTYYRQVDANAVFWKQLDLNKWFDQNLQTKASPNFWDSNIGRDENIAGKVKVSGNYCTDSNCYNANDFYDTNVHHLRFNLINPANAYLIDHEFAIVPKLDKAITVINLEVSCDADPATEPTGDLKYADAFIGMANAVVINDFDTASGVRSDNTITSGAVAAGKAIYISFDASPDSLISQINMDFSYRVN